MEVVNIDLELLLLRVYVHNTCPRSTTYLNPTTRPKSMTAKMALDSVRLMPPAARQRELKRKLIASSTRRKSKEGASISKHNPPCVLGKGNVSILNLTAVAALSNMLVEHDIVSVILKMCTVK